MQNNKVCAAKETKGFVGRLLWMDLWLLAAVIVLLFCGVWFNLSIAEILGNWRYGDPLYFATHQLAHAVIGVVSMCLAACYGRAALAAIKEPRQLWNALMYAWVLLIAVLFMPAVCGVNISIDLVFFKFRPAVFAGLIWLVLVGYQLARDKRPGMLSPLSTIAAVVVTLALIIMESYLALPLLLGLVILLMYRKAGLQLKCVAALVAAMGVMFMTAICSSPYRLARLFGMLFPADYPATYGYDNMIARKLFAEAGFWGGVSADELKRLPDANMDYALAAFTAVHGYVMFFVVTVLLASVVVRGIRIAKAASTQFEALLAWGIVGMLGGQTFLHIIKCLGFVGYNSLGLPFIGYGGSDLIVACIMIGVLLGISAGQKQECCGLYNP